MRLAHYIRGRRFAERIEQKLDNDYLAWYDLPVGAQKAHPDFVILHPRRGLLILEVKDWRLDAIRQASKQTWDIAPDGVPKTVVSPLEQGGASFRRRKVPLALLLIVLAEAAGAPGGAVHALGAVLVVARLASAWGLSRAPGAGAPRQAGAGLTLLVIAAAALLLAVRVLPMLSR